jgi:membrane protein
MFVQFTILAVAMRVLPQVRVRWHAFAAGTLVSLALFDLALYAFGLYTSMVQLDEPVAVVYGSLAAMPLFLLWVYWAWLSVLIGIEVAAVVQDHDRVYALERAAWDARLSPDAQTGQK